MKHIIFTKKRQPSYKIAICIKEANLSKKEIYANYVKPIITSSVSLREEDIIAFSLAYNDNNKCPVSIIKPHINTLFKASKSLAIEYLLIADTAYFKTMVKEKKAEPFYGYVKSSPLENGEDFKILLIPNYSLLFYNPAIQINIDRALEALKRRLKGDLTEPGTDVIYSATYPDSPCRIAEELDKLHKYDALTCDVETFDIDVNRAGLASIAFAWNKHEGLAFTIDFLEERGNVFKVYNFRIRKVLKKFFESYRGKLIFHKASFDTKILINALYKRIEVKDLNKAVLEGISHIFKNVECTYLLTYLATNNTSINKLDLKSNSAEYLGNYAVDDISNIMELRKKDLLEYNLLDCMGTWHVYEKYKPIVIKDKQEEIYENLFLKSLPIIAHMELTGLPIDLGTVATLDIKLKRKLESINYKLRHFPAITNYVWKKQSKAFIKKNLILKKKVKALHEFYEAFKPGSSKQVRELLYDHFKLPVITVTDSGAAATDTATLKKHLLVLKETDEIYKIISYLIDFKTVSIILNTFIKAFKENSYRHRGQSSLHGNFNLGGTVSGRMSSNSPNLQNLPSKGNIYAKDIKKCIRSTNKDWLFAGADFTSLEDYIAALTTGDFNKQKVYLEGYDGHCLRAYSYFKDQMPDIKNTVESINSIKTKYPELRQKSKTVTFALTYAGTAHTLEHTIGFSAEESKKIEANYHELYAEADEWLKQKLKQISKDGYATLAFGLRLRTPILKQTILGNSDTPYEAASESRTVGNALGQSYCLLNTRACTEFMGRVYASKFKYDVKPVAQIHDASYYLIRNNLDCIAWVNKNLIECMQWQELSEIKHDKIKLGGDLEIFLSDWRKGTTVPNNASVSDIKTLING